jgi:hypothetical protein
VVPNLTELAVVDHALLVRLVRGKGSTQLLRIVVSSLPALPHAICFQNRITVSGIASSDSGPACLLHSMVNVPAEKVDGTAKLNLDLRTFSVGKSPVM